MIRRIFRRKTARNNVVTAFDTRARARTRGFCSGHSRPRPRCRCVRPEIRPRKPRHPTDRCPIQLRRDLYSGPDAQPIPAATGKQLLLNVARPAPRPATPALVHPGPHLPRTTRVSRNRCSGPTPTGHVTRAAAIPGCPPASSTSRRLPSTLARQHPDVEATSYQRT